ncbi:MAG: restriction endonuclease [Clostridiales bacterium]|nr:restriction endonuclease [Clostridiales bacterium]
MQKWLENLRRKNYYRGKSLPALLINLIFAELLLFVIGYLWFVQRTKIPLLSLLLSLSILVLMTSAFLLRYKKSYEKKKTDARRKLAREFLADELYQLGKEEFQWQIMRLLLKLDSITDINCSGDILETVIEGKKAVISCHHAGRKEEISPGLLSAFLSQAKLSGCSYAIYVTSGVYPEACRDLSKKKSSLQVQLLDMENLLDLMEAVGMLPDDKTIDGIIDKKIFNQREKLQALKKEILTPRRIRTYLVYSLFFFVLSRLFDRMSLYYLIVAIAFLALALLTWFYNRKNPEKPDEQEPLLKKPVHKA